MGIRFFHAINDTTTMVIVGMAIKATRLNQFSKRSLNKPRTVSMIKAMKKTIRIRRNKRPINVLVKNSAAAFTYWFSLMSVAVGT